MNAIPDEALDLLRVGHGWGDRAAHACALVEADVRQSVARSLWWIYEDGDERGRLEPAVHDALVRRAGDADGDVRDWALFNLGSSVYGPQDSAEAVAAYRAAIDDHHEGTRHEARSALASTACRAI